MTTQTTHPWLTTAFEFIASCGLKEHIYIRFFATGPDGFQYAACPEGIEFTEPNIRGTCPRCGAPGNHLKEWVRPNVEVK